MSAGRDREQEHRDLTAAVAGSVLLVTFAVCLGLSDLWTRLLP